MRAQEFNPLLKTLGKALCFTITRIIIIATRIIIATTTNVVVVVVSTGL